jgi:hypothetical protein
MDETKSTKPKVFLSYSHKDMETAERIALSLKNRGIDIWYDEWNLSVGSSILKEIHDGIRHADFLILFLSKNAIESPRVKEEYEARKVREFETRDSLKILPARLDDCDFPLFLSGRIYADFRHSFVFGFSKLLKAILKEQELNPLDKVFSKYSQQIIEFPNTIKDLQITDILESISSSMEHRWKSTLYSAISVGKCAELNEKSQLEKWLGNTIRDYMEYRVYVHSYNFLINKKIKTYTKEVILLKLLDEIYERLNSDTQVYGLAQSRGGFEHVAADIENVMLSFFSNKVDAI